MLGLAYDSLAQVRRRSWRTCDLMLLREFYGPSGGASLVVGRAIEPTCLAVVHKAQTAVRAISGYRRARWHAFSQRRVRSVRTVSTICNAYVRMRLMQRAVGMAI